MSKPIKHTGKIRYNKQAKAKTGSASADHIKTTPALARPQPSSAPVPPADPSAVVTLAPLGPLVVRTGRPFDDQAGVDEARLPPPSTVAGCLRTAWARARDLDFTQEREQLAADIKAMNLTTLAVAGPLLARPRADGGLALLAPKPADAHYYAQDETIRCLRAEPRGYSAGSGADLAEGLTPVCLTETVQGKPAKGPAWWAWQDLLDFRTGAVPWYADLKDRGWSPAEDDQRTQVAIDPSTLAAASGRLFQTAGLDLEASNPWLQEAAQPGLRLLARCAQPLPVDLVHLGGERRLAHLRPEPPDSWPSPPDNWFSQIQEKGGLTLTLLTPGCFSAGYRPGWLVQGLEGEPPLAPGVRLQLVAVACERWQPHSGWDLVNQQPRPTRKLVPAGATYWFRLRVCPDPMALASLWLASLCDAPQDRCDGFGLALPAPWTPII